MRDDASTPRPHRQGRWLMMACTLGLVAVLLASQHQAPRTGAMSAGAQSTASKGAGSSTVPHLPARPGVDASTPTKGSSATPGRAQPEPTTPGRSVDATPISASSAPTTTTAGPASTSGFGPSVVSPASAVTASPLIFTGWLAGPTSVLASYPFDAGTGRTVTATWSGDASLTLEVACQGGTERHTGLSGVAAHAPSGSCSVTLSGPADVATTSYAIAVQS